MKLEEVLKVIDDEAEFEEEPPEVIIDLLKDACFNRDINLLVTIIRKTAKITKLTLKKKIEENWKKINDNNVFWS